MRKSDEQNDIIPEHDTDMAQESDREADETVVAEEAAGDTIKKLREKLKKVEAEKTEYLTGWQRAKADMINARKRDEEAQRELAKFANERLIVELIPVLDSFEMAMGNKEAWEKADKNWRVGVEYIAQQLKKVLEDNGLVEMNPIGQTFNIAEHEAVSHDPVTDKSQDGKVIAVITKGYSLNGKILKVPKVKVGDQEIGPAEDKFKK
jgi:molecular chaperone GrpE